MWQAVRAFLWTLRLALPKVAVGWMFALLTIDFNRVTILELGVAAVIATTLLSVHYFLAPFQVVIGRIADVGPIPGYRRKPCLMAGSVVLGPSRQLIALVGCAGTAAGFPETAAHPESIAHQDDGSLPAVASVRA